VCAGCVGGDTGIFVWWVVFRGSVYDGSASMIILFDVPSCPHTHTHTHTHLYTPLTPQHNPATGVS